MYIMCNKNHKEPPCTWKTFLEDNPDHLYLPDGGQDAWDYHL